MRRSVWAPRASSRRRPTRAVAERSSFNLIHYASGVKVDLFVKGTSPFDTAEFERRVTMRLVCNARFQATTVLACSAPTRPFLQWDVVMNLADSLV